MAVLTNGQLQVIVDSIATTIRVHCTAQRTHVDVSEDWILDLARNAAMALIEPIEALTKS